MFLYEFWVQWCLKTLCFSIGFGFSSASNPCVFIYVLGSVVPQNLVFLYWFWVQWCFKTLCFYMGFGLSGASKQGVFIWFLAQNPHTGGVMLQPCSPLFPGGCYVTTPCSPPGCNGRSLPEKKRSHFWILGGGSVRDLAKNRKLY